MSETTPRFLLLQARNEGDKMALHEQECFAETLGVTVEEMRCHNLLAGPPSPSDLESVDLLLVGGSGDFSVTDDAPFIHQFIDFLADVCVRQKIPTFGSCFGFQGLVVAAGGEVITDVERAEVGTFDIMLSDAAANDPLFGTIEGPFKAQLGHKDRATGMPSGLTHLAYSERVPFQATRVEGTQVVATQFHPELTRQANTMRYLTYQAGYSVTDELKDRDAVLGTMADSPVASDLLRRWVEQAMSDLAAR